MKTVNETAFSEPLRAFVQKMPKVWRVAAFEDLLAEPVRNGVYKSKEFHGRGIRMVNMGELFGNDFISAQDMKRIELTPDEQRKSCLDEGDLLFARRSLVLEGSGKCALVRNLAEKTTFESSIIRARPNKKHVEPRFLFYLFKSPLGRAIVASIATRTAVSGIRGSELMQLSLPVPPLPVQQAITEVVAAYDDLIDNNTRRIQILEQMAQALYREWFVNFRFPGHAKVKLVASPLGQIPQGWKVQRFDEVASVNAASIRRGEEPQDLLYVDISSVVTGRIEKIEPMKFADAPGRARRIVRHGDTIWSCVRPNRKSFSLILNPPADLIVSTGFAVLTPANVPFSFLHQAVTTDDFVSYLTNHATGAAYPAVTAKDFEAAKLVVPAEPLLRHFHENCEPMLVLKENLMRKNANLRRTRDLLLPKLISGALDVSKLDIETA